MEIAPLTHGTDPFPIGEPGEVAVVASYPEVDEIITAVVRNNTGQPLKDVAFVVEALDENGAIVTCSGHPGLAYPRTIRPGELVWDRLSFCSETCDDLTGVTQTRVRAIGTPGTHSQIVELRVDLAEGSYEGMLVNSQPRDVFFNNIDALCVDESGNPRVPFAHPDEYSEEPIVPGEQVPFYIQDRDFETPPCDFVIVSATAYEPTGGAARHY